MKTTAFFGATLAVLGLAVAPTQAQTQSSTTTTTTTNYVQTSKIVGMKVKGANGEEIGTIKDVVLDRNTGCMAYTVLSTGGTGTRVTGTSKTVAVPWTVYTTSSEPSVMTVRVDRERIYSAPAFDYTRIDEYSTPAYINNVYSYYGVTPGVGGGVGFNAGGTTGVSTQTGVAGQAPQTGVSAQTGAAASPAATASAMPTMTPGATASPAATATARPRATSGAASSRASATPSGESTTERSERPGAAERSAPPGRGHHHREGASPSGSPSEGTSPSELSSSTGRSSTATGNENAEEKTEKAAGRGKRHGRETSETGESTGSKTHTGTSAEASPTP